MENAVKTKKHAGGRPLKFTPDELNDRINDYYAHAKKHKEPLTKIGLCVFLDVERHFLCELGKKKEFSATIKKAEEKIQAYAVSELFRKGGQVAGIIFYLKNNFPDLYKDQIETNVSINRIVVKRIRADAKD
jgi:hypothetical protein